MPIYFEVSSLEQTNNDTASHYEVKFTKPVNASWLILVIREALDKEFTRKCICTQLTELEPTVNPDCPVHGALHC